MFVGLPFKGCAPDSSQRPRKPVVKTAACCAGALVLWVVAGLFLFVLPATDAPEPVDVLLVLAPQGARTAYAEQLMDEGIADTLALSAPQGADGGNGLCTQKRPYRIICFDPAPITTQGEARALRQLAEEYGWRSANVLTAQFHVTRARVLIERCYSGHLGMIAFAREMPLVEFPNVKGSSWAYHFVYESAAFIKVALHQEC